MAHKLLVAIDATEATQKIITYVAAFASQLDELELKLVTVAVGIPADSQELAAVRGEAQAPELHGAEDHTQKLLALRQLLSDAAQELQAAGVSAAKISTLVLADQGGISVDLLEAARDFGCCTLVVGRRQGAGMRHLLLGSTSEQLVEDAENLTLWVVT